MLEPHKQNASNLQTTSKQCMVQSNQMKRLFYTASKLIGVPVFTASAYFYGSTKNRKGPQGKWTT